MEHLLHFKHRIIYNRLLAKVETHVGEDPRVRCKCTADFQMESLRDFLVGGGAVMVLLSEGGEQALDTNINYLLEEFGVMANTGQLFA